MATPTKLVKLERSRFGSKFQVTRACLSAASALMVEDPDSAKRWLNSAILELQELRLQVGGSVDH